MAVNENAREYDKPLHILSIVLGVAGMVCTVVFWHSLWGIPDVIIGLVGIYSTRRARHEKRTAPGFLLSYISLALGASLFVAVFMIFTGHGVWFLNALHLLEGFKVLI